jgi:hypothetical protein
LISSNSNLTSSSLGSPFEWYLAKMRNACSSRPFETSQRGDSSTNQRTQSWIQHGTI